MLYSRFASLLYRGGQQAGYQLMGADASSPSEATYFHLQKVEGISTFIYVTVLDTTRADWQAQLQKNEQTRQQAQNLLTQVQNVALVYLLVEPTTQVDTASIPASVLEPYEGQSVYNVFWRMALDTGQLVANCHQPTDIFGLRDIVQNAYQQATQPEAPFNAVASAESMLGKVQPTNITPMRRTLPNYPNKKSRHGLFARMRYVQLSNYPKYTQPILCYGLLALNLLVFLGMTLSSAGNTGYFAFHYLGIYAPAVMVRGEWWRLITAMFVHFDIFHLIANAFGIIVFGTRIERYFGRGAFFIIYFASGLMGSLFSLANLHFFGSFAVSGGASGAVYGLVAMVFVFTRVTGRDIETLHWRVMLLFIAIGLIMGFTVTGIDNAGHIGGMVGGAILGLVTLLVMMRKQKL